MQTMILPTLDADHRYWLDGREVPGMTAILKAAGLVDTTWFTEYARDRGTAIHDAVLYDNEGDLDEAKLDPAILPYLQQWRRFKKLTACRVMQSEQIVYSPSQDFSGRFDLLLDIHGQYTLIDIKTGKAPKFVVPQLGGYSFAAREQGTVVQAVACLELKPDKFNLIPYDRLTAEAEFFRALAMSRGLASA